MYAHHVIDGRVYRVVCIEAADTHAARQHISAERPEPLSTDAKRRLERMSA